MRVIVFSLALAMLTSLAQAEFVTIVPVQSNSQVQNTNVVDNFGKSVTVRFWSEANNEAASAINKINVNANSVIDAPAGEGQGQLFGFYLNAQQQPGCETAFTQTAEELEMQNAVKVSKPQQPIVLRSEALVAQLLQNLPAANNVEDEYAQLPQAQRAEETSAGEDLSNSLLASDSSMTKDSSILLASSGKSVLDYLLSGSQGENSLDHNAPSSLDSVILASSLGGSGSGGALNAPNEVPEPSSVLLLLLGVSSLFWTRRRLVAKR